MVTHQTCIVKLLVAFCPELLELHNAARHVRETAPKSKVKGNEAKQMKNREGNTLCRFPPALGLVLKNGHSLWKNSLSNAAVATSPNAVSSARITFQVCWKV